MKQVPWINASWKYPLSDDDFMVIGRVAVMWTSIEIMVNLLLRKLHSFDTDQFEAFISKQQMSNEIQLIKTAESRLPSSCDVEAFRNLCERMSAANDDRNSIVHGVWGWRPNDKEQNHEAFAVASRGRTKWFSGEGLVPLHNDVAKISLELDDLVTKIIGLKPRAAEGRTIYIGQGDPRPWFPGHDKIQVIDQTR